MFTQVSSSIPDFPQQGLLEPKEVGQCILRELIYMYIYLLKVSALIGIIRL